MATLRVLLVDDSEAVRRGVCHLLESHPESCLVRVAGDGLEAVRQAEAEKPDIILLDVSLPGLSGIEAARQIRRVAPDSKILFLSQHDSWAGVREALNAGGTGYVVKSDAPRDLITAIQKVCQGKKFISSTLVAHDRRHAHRG